MGIHFHPQIKLDRKKGFEFAATLADFVDPQNVQLEGNSWAFNQPLGTSPDGGLQMTVTQSTVQFDVAFPSHPLEWIEQRFGLILSEFAKQFKPKLILTSKACFRGVMQVDGDARTFLAKHLVNIDESQLKLLRRPIHLFGIRFFLPPFEVVAPSGKGKRSPKGQVTDWHVDVKAESLLEDPTKLFLEAEAQWPSPVTWDEANVQKIIGHLQTVATYLEKDVVGFLKKSSDTTEEKE